MCKSGIQHAEQQVSSAQQQLAESEAAVAAHKTRMEHYELEVSAASVVSDDLKAQLVKALAAKTALSGETPLVVTGFQTARVTSQSAEILLSNQSH